MQSSLAWALAGSACLDGHLPQTSGRPVEGLREARTHLLHPSLQGQ